MLLRWIVWALAAASALTGTGCFTVAKQAYNEMRGAQGKLEPIAPAVPRSLAAFQGVTFAPATTTIGSRLAPPALLRTYDRSASKASADLRVLFPGGEPLLTIETEVLYFQSKGLLGQAQFLTRVRMKGGGEPVLDALVVAESNAFRAGGESALAQASVEAITRFLRQQKGMSPRAGEAAHQTQDSPP